MRGKKHTIDEFKKIAEKMCGECLSETYKNSKTKLEFKCSQGHKWFTLPQNIIKGHWCIKCHNKKSIKYNIEFFKKLAEDKGGKCVSDVFLNSMGRLNFECSNGHLWSSRASHIIEGRWCPECPTKARKYTVDHDFFSRDTEESCYISGFLAADGNVCKTSNKISILLATRDIEHLYKIRTALKCDNPIYSLEKKNTIIVGRVCNKTLYSSCFCFNSKKCKKDLEKFDVFPNKTYYLRFPEWLQKHPLVHHYIRGYIDGDGCFTYGSKNIKIYIFQ